MERLEGGHDLIPAFRSDDPLLALTIRQQLVARARTIWIVIVQYVAGRNDDFGIFLDIFLRLHSPFPIDSSATTVIWLMHHDQVMNDHQHRAVMPGRFDTSRYLAVYLS
jgi:hypothetical protein